MYYHLHYFFLENYKDIDYMIHLSSLCSLFSQCSYNIIVVINLCFSFSAGMFVVPSFLSFKTPDGRGGWPA